MEVGKEINYKGVELIYSGFQMENKLCFYIKNSKEQMMYLSLSQLKNINK